MEKWGNQIIFSYQKMQASFFFSQITKCILNILCSRQCIRHWIYSNKKTESLHFQWAKWTTCKKTRYLDNAISPVKEKINNVIGQFLLF